MGVLAKSNAKYISGRTSGFVDKQFPLDMFILLIDFQRHAVGKNRIIHPSIRDPPPECDGVCPFDLARCWTEYTNAESPPRRVAGRAFGEANKRFVSGV